MIKKSVTYTDYNGIERTETFRFNLTKAELTEWQMSLDGGIERWVREIAESKNQPELIRLFKDLLRRSYGELSPDGRRLIKTEEAFDAFAQTEAYSVIFMELATDSEKAAAFFNGILPSDMQQNGNKPAMIQA